MTLSKFLKKIIHSYQSRVIVTITLLTLAVLFLSNILINKFVLESQVTNIRSRLKLIAQTAALMIDAEKIKAIPLSKEGAFTPEFSEISGILNKIKQLDPQIRYIYTMARTDQPNFTQFIVDADTTPGQIIQMSLSRNKSKNRNLLAVPGDYYDASQAPEMFKAFDEPSADKQLTHDAWGALLSGYAPIKDKNGTTVAILGVDFSAEDIDAILDNHKSRLWLCFQICLIFGLLLGFLMAQSIIGPFSRLAYGIHRVSRGDLQYRLTESRKDEIGELMKEFNGMSRRLYRSRRQLITYFSSVVKSLIRVLEARNPYTKGHSDNVADYAGRIALKMGFPREDVKLFKKITLLHDIGKVGVRDEILNKEGPLTKEEFDELKKHPEIGEQIVKPIMKNQQWLSIIRHHHERADGAGYPDKIDRDNINIFAAIVTVADSYDAMTSDRSYRKAMSQEDAIKELIKHRGTQFHPDVVDAFIEILKKEKNR